MEKVIRIEHLILKGIKTIMIRYLAILPLMLQNEIQDLDSLFKNAKWEEVQNVQDEGYEVEKVTMVAGVRGNEAEHEILNHLYYLKNSKMGLKSPKPFEINIIR